jgi:hypothetical protein
MNDEIESMRDTLCRVPDDLPDASNSRRPIPREEIPKLVSFLSADARKRKDLEKDRTLLGEQLAALRQSVADTNKRIRDAMSAVNASEMDQSSLVKSSIKSVNSRINGFVPIDSVSNKRKREVERLQEIENRKPTLSGSQPDIVKLAPDSKYCLQSLSLLVNMLSDGEDDNMDIDAFPTQPVATTYYPPPVGSLESFFNRPPDVILLD